MRGILSAVQGRRGQAAQRRASERRGQARLFGLCGDDSRRSTVAAAMSACLTLEGEFGNPGSASHSFGEAAAALVDTARVQVAAASGEAAGSHLDLGSTEPTNLRYSAARRLRERGLHIVTSRTEHKAVLDPAASSKGAAGGSPI